MANPVQENCVVTRDVYNNNGHNTGWNDKSCTALRCAVCQLDSVPTFEIRGNFNPRQLLFIAVACFG